MTSKSKTTPSSGISPELSLVFFGNEKLVTGGSAKSIIREGLLGAGFNIEQVITGKLSELGKHKSQIAVLAAYGHIIPQRVLDEFPLGIINVHPSLLPQYRGPTPIETAILDGATKTGVSIMKLSRGMDEGPLYRQEAIHLTGSESKQALAEELQTLGAELLIELLPKIASRELQPRQQPHPDRATYSQKLTKQDGVLDFAKSAQQLEREIRAFSEWPKSTTTLANLDIVITQASVVNQSEEPGTYRIQDKQLLLYCQEGALSIERLKPAGKPDMTTEAFLAGYKSRLAQG